MHLVKKLSFYSGALKIIIESKIREGIVMLFLIKMIGKELYRNMCFYDLI